MHKFLLTLILSILLIPPLTLLYPSCGSESEPPEYKCPYDISGMYTLNKIFWATEEGMTFSDMNLEQKEEIEEYIFDVEYMKGYDGYFVENDHEGKYGIVALIGPFATEIYLFGITCGVDPQGIPNEDCTMDGIYVNIFEKKGAFVRFTKLK